MYVNGEGLQWYKDGQSKPYDVDVPKSYQMCFGSYLCLLDAQNYSLDVYEIGKTEPVAEFTDEEIKEPQLFCSIENKVYFFTYDSGMTLYEADVDKKLKGMDDYISTYKVN